MGSRTLPWALAAAVALAGGAAASRAVDVHVSKKSLSGLEWRASDEGAGATVGGAATAASPIRTSPAGSSALPALPLRLVDAGGVGIPADTADWGSDYSHATHVFDDLWLDGPPWVDPAAFARLRGSWRHYLDRMASYGDNGVVVPAFLSLMQFDRVGDGTAIYPADDPLRARQAAFDSSFGTLARDARDRGMGVYLATDLPVVSPELRDWLRRNGALDTSQPSFWKPYAAGLDELFDRFPDVQGVVVRIGEAGPLFKDPSSPYSSYLGVRTPEELRTLLRTLLPTFERHHRLLILRSWSVGVGPLGHLHDDPAVYSRALGGIDSPSLVVSTKFVQGDYFGFLPLNPTLAVGRQKRLVEFQARREYEGFGALPDFLAGPHGRALQELRRENPNIVGGYLWTQEGGPLRASPLSLYGVTGFNTWTDANVFATSRLMQDPAATPRELAREWVRRRISSDPAVVKTLSDVLSLSREAMEEGFYVRPYATRRVDVMGVQVPPLVWVFEWNVIGGWTSSMATFYDAVGDRAPTAIQEGFQSVALTRRMENELESLAPKLAHDPRYPRMVRSLQYQESLFRALAWYRTAFLRYYAWLDHGGSPARWRSAARSFESAASSHESRFEGDLDFPAFDFTPAVRALKRAGDASRPILEARLVLGLVVLLLAFATPWLAGLLGRRSAWPGPRTLRRGALTPWMLPGTEGADGRASWFAGGMALLVVAAAVSLALSRGFGIVGLGVGVALGVFASTLTAAWRTHVDPGGPGASRAPGALTPLLLAAILPLGAMALRGPDFFWLLFWTRGVFRALVIGMALLAVAWTLGASTAIARRVVPSRRSGAGGILLALGAALLITAAFLPQTAALLRDLDDPFQLVPMRRAIISAILNYQGVPSVLGVYPAVAGILLVTMGFGIQWSSRLSSTR